jgi:hypothetical protein
MSRLFAADLIVSTYMIYPRGCGAAHIAKADALGDCCRSPEIIIGKWWLKCLRLYPSL